MPKFKVIFQEIKLHEVEIEAHSKDEITTETVNTCDTSWDLLEEYLSIITTVQLEPSGKT